MENDIEKIKALPIAPKLIAWYDENARDLPWRRTSDPYCIWVSEIMLQQTRVEAVKPYYVNFLAALPDVHALAQAEEDALFKLWEGLGYYSRVRNMQRAAKQIVEKYNGEIPQTVQELASLPGIGPYTAGAIASIAFGEYAPAVDGNVLRVLARLSGSACDIALPATRRMAQDAVLSMMQDAPPKKFNQALMELGACVCLPNAAPLCLDCPLSALCIGFLEGKAATLPVKSAKAPRRMEERTAFVLMGESGAFLVRKRADTGLLAGLWELPNMPGHLTQSEMLAQIGAWELLPAGPIAVYSRKHLFTHVEWRLRVYALPIIADALPPAWEWRKHVHALPSAFKICLPH